MSTATSGRAREYKVRDHLIQQGFELIMRAAGSKGPADIAMAHEEHGLALVQVGTAGKALGPADRTRLLRAAHLCSALPILATVHRGAITYRIVTNETPRHWAAWELGES
ncbi:hypothetical protein ACIPY0_00135 [Paenarthrobacter nicotinovorans]|uniref:hypothetical protein n=1 Tax=Paenarthrobacter nicotinovorans TaxID=29320 RepID=UPI0038287CE2